MTNNSDLFPVYLSYEEGFTYEVPSGIKLNLPKRIYQQIRWALFKQQYLRFTDLTLSDVRISHDSSYDHHPVDTNHVYTIPRTKPK